MTDPASLTDVVSRRADLLRSLREESKTRHVLVDHVDASKSTVYKGVTQLQEQGLVESTPSGLELTLFGRVVLARYDELARTAELGPLLADLSADAVDPAALVGAESVLPDDRNVNRHHDRLEGLLRGATAVRGFSPSIAPTYVSIIHDRLDDGRFSLEFVLPADLIEFFRRERPDAFADIRANPHATLYRTGETLSLTLALIDSPDGTQVCIEVGGEGPAAGLLLNDTAESLRWAERTCERVEATSDPVGDEGEQ